MLRLFLFILVILSVKGNDDEKKEKEDLLKVHLKGLGNVVGNKFWDGEFYEFFGIPYATVPKGRDRFKAPLPPTPWNEDLKANRAILMCQQIYFADQKEEENEDMIYGEENCLVSSFMVPKLANEKNLVPVIVYIHSGAYFGGSGNMAKYHFLARHDVIVANINYRLGAIGFACLGTEEIPGNAALKDIIAGLKFIKKHIRSFGGDPDNITLAGFSIGSSLAELVALSKESKGLFSKLALDSGSALNPFAVNRHPLETARNAAISIGYEDTGDIEELNEFYLEADLQDMLAASRNVFLKNSTFGFTPCIENPKIPGGVLTESPIEIIKKGDYGDFGLLVGFGSMEGISRVSQFDEWREEMNKNLADFLPGDLAFTNDKEKEDFIRELKKFYFKDKPLTDDIESVKGFINYFSDSMFKNAILKSVKLHAKNLKRPIYLYEFSYVGKLGTKHTYVNEIRGASHRDASAYILDFYDWTRNFTDMDRRNLMTTMWSDYLMFENPTAYESSLLTTKWLPYKVTEPNYLDFGDELIMKKNPFTKAYELWEKAYEKNYWSPTPVNPDAFEPSKKPPVKRVVKEIPTPPKPAQEQPSKSSADTKKEPPAPNPSSNSPKTESKDDSVKNPVKSEEPAKKTE